MKQIKKKPIHHLKTAITIPQRYGRVQSGALTLLAAGLAVAVTGALAQAPPPQNPPDGGAPPPKVMPPQGTAAKPKPVKGAGKATATKSGKPAPARDIRNRSAGRGVPGPGGPLEIIGGQNGGRPPFLPGIPPGGPGGPQITIQPAGTPGNTVAPGTRFSFDFKGADILNVLKLYSQMSNMSVLADPGLSGTVTIINPKQVTLDEAFQILQSVLAVRGFTAIQTKNAISIMPFESAARNTPLLNSGLSEDGTTKVDPRNQVMTQVIPLENVDADALSKELAPLINKGASLIASSGTNALIITDTASNVQRFIDLCEALDKTSSQTELKTYPLRRAEASAVADIISNLFKQTSARGRGGAAPQPGQPGFNPGAPQQGGGGGIPAVVAVADARTNSVLVVASPATQQRIATDIINRLDDDETNTLDTKIRKINYADATQVANLVNSVLSNLHTGGAAAQQNNQSSFQQRAFGFFGGGGNNNNQQTTTSTDPFAKVVADPRTNSIIITASTDRIAKIDELIDSLDENVTVEPTTFVFQLKNAQADDVAYALGQSFGTSNSNSNNPFGFFGFGNNNNNQGLNGNRHTPIQRRLSQTQSQSGRAVGRRGVPPVPPNAPEDDPGQAAADANGGSAVPQGVQGVMTPNGFVPTSTDTATGTGGQEPTRQFFGFGRGFGFGQQNSAPTSGRGKNGNFTNLLQLRDNVYVTAAPGGDSVIVTTTPDNYDAVKQIIEALDVVPRQVMIEVIVAEVTLDADQKLGFSSSGLFQRLFGKTNSANGVLNLPAPGFNSGGSDNTFNSLNNGAQFSLSAANYSALLEALETNSKVKVLATPRVFTANSQQAEIDITTRIPYIQGQTSNGFSTQTTNTITTADIGYILNVTPRITRQGLVTLDVTQQADNLLRFETLGSGQNASQYPVVNDRYVDTEVTGQDGQTIVLGGLINDTDTLSVTKIPLLSDIPVLGQFFRGRERTRSRTELVLFMTPHAINSAQEAHEMALKAGEPVIRQIPDLSRQQPNLASPKGLKSNQHGNNKGIPSNKQPGKTPADGTAPSNGGVNPNINGGAP